ncbi:ABC transporter ATP-binding protein [Halostella salina]|uniref:ABC transporter ATP-binding protein n=1 Tax=Halostella salina TaxID=1547897 RepID=UPI000EF82D45|nr:ABC transporter ATP-binding protein [Halostella salina]
MTDRTPAIETHELTKRYPDGTLAVDDLDLSVAAGEVYGFLGPNGAGKSTTIDVLVGVLEPTAGSATVLDRDVATDSRAVRSSTGLLPGEFGLFEQLTAREHVRFALDCKRASGEAAALLDRVGLADAADRRTKGFSTGMQRRLALAMALAGDPDLLILDEPTRGLDPNGAREVRSIVREAAARDTTVFFSSHSMSQVEAVCDRVGVLRDGRLVAEGTVDTLIGELDDRRLVVTVDRVSDDLADRLERVDAVSGVSIEDRDVIVSLTTTRGKAAVVDAVESAGAAVVDIGVREPSLADVFAAATTDGGAGTEAAADEPDRASANAEGDA